MNDVEILSLAYQRQAQGDTRELPVIADQVRADLLAMQPPAPGPADQIGFKSETIRGVRTNYKVMGDGSVIEIEQ